nr:hypothetical protein [uncultured Rhodoferax sp.]
MNTVTVSAPALRELLEALSGPGHLIRELQMLSGPLVGKDNPINILVDQYNAAIEAKPHSDDEAVDRFAEAMKAKLASARAKGRSGWGDPDRCTVEHLSDLLHGHVANGDPVDVANFCMMLNERGAGIANPAAATIGDDPQEVCKSRSYIDGVEYDAASFRVGYEQGRYDESMAQGPTPTIKESLIVGDLEALRQRLGEALTEVLTDPDAAQDPDWNDAREIDRVIDAILPVMESAQIVCTHSAGERVELIAKLREYDACLEPVHQAADMLAADAFSENVPIATPTTGMTIEQRILHVGGRNNEAGYVEFGSVQAVEALVRQVLRDLPTAKPAQQVAVPQGWKMVPVVPSNDMMMTASIQGGIFNQYAAMLAAAPQPPQAKERVPMTELQLSDLMPINTSMGREDTLRWMARAVERHHGIVGKP